MSGNSILYMNEDTTRPEAIRRSYSSQSQSSESNERLSNSWSTHEDIDNQRKFKSGMKYLLFCET